MVIRRIYPEHIIPPTQCDWLIILINGLQIIPLICSDKSGMLEIMSNLASEERLFYYQLALIWQAVLTPFLQSGDQSVTFCCSYE